MATIRRHIRGNRLWLRDGRVLWLLFLLLPDSRRRPSPAMP